MSMYVTLRCKSLQIIEDKHIWVYDYAFLLFFNM